MNNVEIGVVVPTFNSAETLEWTVLALKNQEGCRVKIVVVDSGSSDDTLEICARHKLRTEYDPPGNMYRAINVGMRLLDTEWTTYLNSDDIVYRNAYSRMIALGNRAVADVVYGHSDFIDWDGRFRYSFMAAHPILLRGLVFSGVLQFSQPAAIFRKVVYEDLKGFSEKYRSISDFDFFARAILTGQKFERLTFPTVTAFRLHPNQFSHKESGIVIEETAQFFQEWRGKKSFISPLLFGLWRFLNARHYLLRFLRNGQFKSRSTDSKGSSY
ncbi:MAG: glycosyltransferase [Desulfobacterales bacterium]|nr:glycosyltransferase [Desulfobacterales bacterium]